MKITKILFFIAILGLVMNLGASVRINGLGSYFEYLIPDIETDIELFPSHISEYESRYVQVFNNFYPQSYDGFNAENINLSILPLSNKLSIRINTDFASNNNEPRIYLDNRYGWYNNITYFDNDEYGASLINNTISYEFSNNFHLGCFFKYGINWKESVHDELEKETPDFNVIEDIEDIKYDNDYLSTGINFRLLHEFKTDIALMYSKNDIEDLITYKYITERFDTQNNNDRFDRYVRENLESIEKETEDIGLSILVETNSTDMINRFLIDTHYIRRSANYTYDYLTQRIYYVNDELDFEKKEISEDDKMEDMELYTVNVGFGKAVTKDNLDIFYGVRLFGMYGETVRNESYYILDFRQDIETDTTYTDSMSVSGVNNFEINDWKVAIEVPFGVSYKLNEAVQLFGGMGLKLIRQELEYFDDNEFSRWETDRYIALGTTISPFECLKIDVNFGGDFAYFKSWQIDLKYLW